MKANLHLLRHFTEKNSLSAFRFYTFIANKYNNHLQRRHFAEIRTSLGISDKVIHNNLRQLIDMGMCTKHGAHYWRFSSWRKIADHNRSSNIYIDLKTLKNLKKLRTLFYMSFVRTAIYLSRKNSQQAKTSFRLKLSGYNAVSNSFIKSFCGYSEKTISKHNRRAESFGYLNIKRKFTILAQGSLQRMQEMKKLLDLDGFIRKYKGQYQIIKYETNQLKFLL